MSRKPFEIGDKVIRISGNKNVFTVIGKTLSGQPLIQMEKHCALIHMHDPSEWEHYVEPKVGYVNIYTQGNTIHNTVEESKQYAYDVEEQSGTKCIARIKVTYKEGQFDD